MKKKIIISTLMVATLIGVGFAASALSVKFNKDTKTVNPTIETVVDIQTTVNIKELDIQTLEAPTFKLDSNAPQKFSFNIKAISEINEGGANYNIYTAIEYVDGLITDENAPHLHVKAVPGTMEGEDEKVFTPLDDTESAALANYIKPVVGGYVDYEKWLDINCVTSGYNIELYLEWADTFAEKSFLDLYGSDTDTYNTEVAKLNEATAGLVYQLQFTVGKLVDDEPQLKEYVGDISLVCEGATNLVATLTNGTDTYNVGDHFSAIAGENTIEISNFPQGKKLATENAIVVTRSDDVNIVPIEGKYLLVAGLDYVITVTLRDVVEKDDLIDCGFTGVTSGYTPWEKLGSKSNILYAGTTCKDGSGENMNVQFRSKVDDNKYVGIVSKSNNGETLKKVNIVFDEKNSNGATLDIYASNTPYSSTSDLYGDNPGTLIGSAIKSDKLDCEITTLIEYKYIGIRSNNGTIYLDSITIIWEA